MSRTYDPAHSGHIFSRLAFSKIPYDLSPHLVLNQSEALGVLDPELAMLSLAWTVLTVQACQERESGVGAETRRVKRKRLVDSVEKELQGKQVK